MTASLLLDFVALLCNCVTWLRYFATSLRYIPCPLASRFPYVASLQSYIASETETETETEMMTETEPELQTERDDDGDGDGDGAGDGRRP